MATHIIGRDNYWVYAVRYTGYTTSSLQNSCYQTRLEQHEPKMEGGLHKMLEKVWSPTTTREICPRFRGALRPPLARPLCRLHCLPRGANVEKVS